MILAARGGSNYSWSSWSDYQTGPFLSPISIDSSTRDPVGLTAVAAAVRLVSETIGAFVMRVYTGDGEQRQPLYDAPQADILQDGAQDYATSFDLWSDVSTGIELTGNAFIWKGRLKGSQAVAELYAFPSDAVRVYVTDAGDKVVEARIGSDVVDITSDVIHVRGWSPFVQVAGVSTPALHTRTVRGAISLEEYRGRYFDSDATPSIVLTHPGQLSPEQRAEARQSWNARHGGPNGENTAVLWNGLTVQQLKSTLDEAQLAELTASDALQVARMFRIYPPGLLAAGADATLPTAENAANLFIRFSLLGRFRRIERALSADRDLFPDRNQYARFDLGEFNRGDTATTAAKVHALKQVGIMTANEGRGEIGLPPSTDPAADSLQATPVGGAPNQNGQVPASSNPNPAGVN